MLRVNCILLCAFSIICTYGISEALAAEAYDPDVIRIVCPQPDNVRRVSNRLSKELCSEGLTTIPGTPIRTSSRDADHFYTRFEVALGPKFRGSFRATLDGRDVTKKIDPPRSNRFPTRSSIPREPLVLVWINSGCIGYTSADVTIENAGSAPPYVAHVFRVTAKDESGLDYFDQSTFTPPFLAVSKAGSWRGPGPNFPVPNGYAVDFNVKLYSKLPIPPFDIALFPRPNGVRTRWYNQPSTETTLYNFSGSGSFALYAPKPLTGYARALVIGGGLQCAQTKFQAAVP